MDSSHSLWSPFSLQSVISKDCLLIGDAQWKQTLPSPMGIYSVAGVGMMIWRVSSPWNGAGTSGWETQLASSVPEKLPSAMNFVVPSWAWHVLQAELHVSCQEIHRSHYYTWRAFQEQNKWFFYFSVMLFLCSIWENTYNLSFFTLISWGLIP